MAEPILTQTIGVTLKLRPTCAQAATMQRWLWHLTAVYNWAVKTIERDAERRVYRSTFDMYALVNGHSRRLEIPRSAIRGTIGTAHNAWQRAFHRVSRRPKLKGRRRPLNSIAFSQANKRPIRGRRIYLAGLGEVRFHEQAIPDGKIVCLRVVKRASGWYVCLFMNAAPRTIPRVAAGQIGIDPGFSSLLTLSSGELIEHPKELKVAALRLAQAQRGKRRRLTARIQERIANRRKNRNHHLSRQLVAENTFIAFSKDRIKAIEKRFGKSTASAAHAQLRSQLRYKSLTGGTKFIEVPSRNSTRTCSACGALTGPTGWSGLTVRQWTCGCGAEHERDVNAARNTLFAALGTSVESRREAASGIASKATSRGSCLVAWGPLPCTTADLSTPI